MEGRGGDGSVVHACLLGACGAGNRSKSGPGSRFQSNRVTRSAAASAAQNVRHMRDVRHRHRPTELILTSTHNLENQLAACNILANSAAWHFLGKIGADSS